MNDSRGHVNNSNEELPRPSSLASNTSTTSSLQLELVGSRVCQVIVPILCCSLYVTLLTRILEWNLFNTGMFSRAWERIGVQTGDSSQTFGETLLDNIVIVAVFVALIILMTLLMLLIFYMRWHNCLAYYFYIPSLLIMAFITPIVISSVLISLNLTLDYITLVIIIWNFAAFGMMCIFDLYIHTPIYAQQFYLIHNSAVLSVLIISVLPGWAPWLLLVFLIFWDLFAVLAPIGPLNLIIDIAEREGIIEMPGLIYATDPNHEPNQATSNLTKTKPVGSERQQHSNPNIDETSQGRKSIQEKGVHLGLGDFIFYSILIGLTVRGRKLEDFYATLAALDGLTVGLVLTLGILAATKRALPALPISIALGLIFAAGAHYTVPDLFNELAAAQTFI